jgi:hypothetical protein
MRVKALVVFLAVTATAHADDAAAPRVADQELGARVGLGLNLAGVGPGGLYLAGTWLYRLTSGIWFDGRAGFTIGGGGSNCSFPATGASHCDSAVVSGFGAELLAGVRWFLPSSGPLQPWIGGGIGGLYANFSGDNLGGVGLPFWAAGGVRARVSANIALGGEALLSAGPIRYEAPIRGQGFANLHVIFGIDFAL